MDWKNMPVIGQAQYYDPRQAQAQAASTKTKKKEDNLLASLLPMGGGIAGAAGGAALGAGIGSVVPVIGTGIGGLLGALIGGAAGGGGGKVAENAIEGNKNIWEGVPQEAALSGIMGAGPLRLGKAAIDTVRGVKAGAGLTEALTKAGTNAVEGSITGKLGEKLTNASNDLAVKDFRLTPTQLNNFSTKYGEDASQVIKRYGLSGKDASTITESTIKPLQNEFDTIATKVATVPTADVLKSFSSRYEPLIGSAVQDKQVIGQQLKQQAEAIAKKYGTDIPSTELNNLRKEFDGLVSYADKAANPARYGVNKRSADAAREALQTAADNTGIKSSQGMTFKEVGNELSKLRQLTNNIGRQEQLGRGNLPVGLGNAPGAIIGAAGGLPVAAAGYGVNAALNSNVGRRLLTSGAEKLGNKLTQKAAETNPYSIGQVAKRVVPVGLAGAIMDDQSLGGKNSSQNTSVNSMSSTEPINNNIPQLYNNVNSSASSASANPYPRENMLADIQRDPKNAQDYMKYYQTMQEIYQAPAQTKYSGSTAGTITDMYKGLQTLQDLSSMVGGQDYAGGVIQGNVRKLNPFDTTYKQQQAMVDTARQIVGKAMEGGVLRKEDEEKYKKILPTMQDDPEVAVSKINYITNVIANNMQQYTGLVSGGGNSLSDVLSSLQ